MGDSVMTRVSELYIVQSILDFSVIVIAYSFKENLNQTVDISCSRSLSSKDRKQKTEDIEIHSGWQ